MSSLLYSNFFKGAICFSVFWFWMEIYNNNKKSTLPLYISTENKLPHRKILSSVPKPFLRNILWTFVHSSWKFLVQFDIFSMWKILFRIFLLSWRGFLYLSPNMKRNTVQYRERLNFVSSIILSDGQRMSSYIW